MILRCEGCGRNVDDSVVDTCDQCNRLLCKWCDPLDIQPCVDCVQDGAGISTDDDELDRVIRDGLAEDEEDD